jgi:hypothetical protein
MAQVRRATRSVRAAINHSCTLNLLTVAASARKEFTERKMSSVRKKFADIASQGHGCGRLIEQNSTG